ncbi:aminotransferase [Acidocella aquatica]|uniref:Aminotransferase n=1 Tax=Acidocella aquatica TaxID=1922313 RepID=A0ABQ6A4C2_9PROT|nr:aminotransferase class III-fold pyridoxal phosphate-dependent enzyme [Acidocella aquatica]GLR67009.1 aminotransferase [Acidocella aquatica]
MTTETRLVALETSPPAFTQDSAEMMAWDVFGVAGTAQLLYGERDQNFRIRPEAGDGIILKILGPDEDAAAVEFQTGALEHIAMMDPALPVPRVHRTLNGEAYTRVNDDAGVAHIVRALRFQPGRIMAGVEPGAALLRNTGATLARLDRALANYFHPAAGQRIVWDLRRIVELRPSAALIEPAAVRALVEGVLDRFIAFMPEMARLRHQMVHNDLHPGNMLINEAASAVNGLLDFGDMIHAPLVFDIAVTAAETTGTNMSPIDYAAEVIAGYNAVTPLEDAEFPALFEAIIARHAQSATIHAWRRHNDPEGAEKLGSLSALSAPAIEAFLSAGRDAVVAKFRAVAASRLDDDAHALPARRQRVLGRGLELSYREPVHLVRGEGVFLYAPDGRRYLDAYNNVPSVGHGNRRVAEAIGRQMATLCTNTRYLHAAVVEYAERLTATMPEGLENCLFVNSGSEANDAAWRIAKIVTGRGGALVMASAYHGVSDAVAALSPYYGPFAQPQAPFVQTLEPPDTYRGRFTGAGAAAHYAADADRAIAALQASGHGVAALMIDSAFVSNGILNVPDGYFAAVAAKVRAAGGLVIGDEVQSGFGRMGDAFWGFARHGVVPDLVTLGKPMANGYPAGAVVTRAELLRAFTDKIDFFSTFGGNPAAAAAALATLDVLQDENLQENALTTGRLLRQGIHTLAARHAAIGDVRGSGLMIGVEIVSERAHRTPAPELARQIANKMRHLGVLIGTEGPDGNVLKIRPPLPFGQRHAAMLLEALDQAL